MVFSNDEEKRRRQYRVKDEDDADAGKDDAEDDGDGEKKAICRGRKMRHKWCVRFAWKAVRPPICTTTSILVQSS